MKNASIGHDIDTAIRGKPDIAVVILGELADVLRGNSSRAIEPADLPVFVDVQPSQSGGDPQSALAVLQEVRDGWVKIFGVARVEDGHRDTVEPGEAIPGADPEKAVARLRDTADGCLGQAVLDIPLFQCILGVQNREEGKANARNEVSKQSCHGLLNGTRS